MVFKEFVRKPFVVEAVEITTENIAECAKHIGDLCEKDDGSPFIQVERRLIPNVDRVFPGYWMTRMDDSIRCYSKKVFKQQFVEQDADIKQWINYMNGKKNAEGEPK
jgi:hypothetical protein